MTLASPRVVTMMFPGLISRWRMPCAWASLNASTIWTAIRSVSGRSMATGAAVVERFTLDVLQRDELVSVGLATSYTEQMWDDRGSRRPALPLQTALCEGIGLRLRAKNFKATRRPSCVSSAR